MKPADNFDRRVFGRRRTDISAQVRIGYRVIQCVIKDISEGGALLEFSSVADLPARLWLSWPEHKTEILCEVRHTRRNTAGVQFSRSQTMALRPAVAPSEPLALHPTSLAAAPDRAAAANASDIVAERRRAIRAPVGEVSPVKVPGRAAEPPRDISTLMQSLKSAAASIVEARAAAAVPMPLAAGHYAGSCVEPPTLPASGRTVRPMPAVRYAGAIVTALAAVVRAEPPRPLAALEYTGAASVPPGLAPWRQLSKLPPRPLPASYYGPRQTAAVVVRQGCATRLSDQSGHG